MTPLDSDIPSPSNSAEFFDFLVPAEHAGIRLDHFLVSCIPGSSRSTLIQSIRMGLFVVDGVKKKVSYRLKTGECIQGEIFEKPSNELVAQVVPFDILFEDDHLLIISKPPGIVVHPANGNPDGTLVNGLLHHYREIADVGDLARPGIVHRLDKDTSGIMVVAKSSQCHRLLVEAFKERRVEKEYLALVYGYLKEANGRLVANIARHPVNRKKMAVCVEGRGRYAATSWNLVEAYEEGCSLLRVKIETGRTHQIRVHMASLGHPVAGDTLYGRARNTRKYPRQMLHAHRLRLIHPISGAELDFSAPLWADFSEIVLSLRGNGFESFSDVEGLG